ncbi:hypothetical protein CRENBAI_008262 [Crenichthys baileyi]|uniref:Uncharacterized protein n=1 Tax=Crenichthys baileyi TaxID=28760 RepID=A0AAV9RUK3_9TELE
MKGRNKLRLVEREQTSRVFVPRHMGTLRGVTADHWKLTTTYFRHLLDFRERVEHLMTSFKLSSTSKKNICIQTYIAAYLPFVFDINLKYWQFGGLPSCSPLF